MLTRCQIIALTLVMTTWGGPRAGSLLYLEPLVSGLDSVTDITNAGDERLFLVEKDGRILIHQSGALLATPFLDISGLVSGGFENGLLGLAFHPDYATNGYFFVNYTNLNGHSVLARYSRSAADPDQADPASAAILITVDHPNAQGHYGGQVAFGPDGYLYTSFGDGGTQTDPECDAQDTASLLGTVIRIDVDQNVSTSPYHAVPDDNPFVAGGHLPEVWGYGLRNPWRFDLDADTGQLFLSDVGQNAREEVSVTLVTDGGGENFGWGVMEGTACFDPDPVNSNCPAGTPSCFDAAYTPPAIEYDHMQGECSITGGVVYRGQAIPGLYGHYLYGDWCTGRMWSADTTQGLTPELLPFTVSALQAFGRDHEGEVYLTQGTDVYRIAFQDQIFSDGLESP